MMEHGRKEKIRLRVYSSAEEREHFHQDIELLFMLEGNMDVECGGQVSCMEAGDILVINANKKHCLKPRGEVLYAQLMIEYNMVSDVLDNMNVIYWCDSTKDENNKYDELRSILKHLLNHQLSKGSTADFGHIALSYRVMDYLSMYFLVQTSDREINEEDEKFDDRIQQINNYIRSNYSQPINLKDLADRLYLSNGYLSRFFKRNYGMSFVEYLTNVRLFHAVDDLLYTNTPVTRIAYDNGFSSVAVFNKAFKKTYGETPSVFRKNRKSLSEAEENPIPDKELEKRLENYLMASGPAAEEKTELVCEDTWSVSGSKPLINYWGNMINIGAAADLLRSEIREHVMLLHEALKFSYVRFWNIFSREMLIDMEQENGEYNFTKLDSIIDFLLQLGIRPHIDFGMKPRIIMYNVQKMELEGTRDIAFFEYEKWDRITNAIMRHLTHRYGSSEIDRWRLELWFNENKWDEPGAFEQYFGLFEILYKNAHKYSEHVKVGGCGIRLDYQEEMRKTFYDQWMKRPVKPDFLSIIFYSYDRGEEKKDIYAKRSSDNELMMHRFYKEKNILKKSEAGDIPLYITEWNLTASARNFINDSCFKGAYIIKNILDVYGDVDDMGYFLGSDRTSEFYDSGELLYGGTGVISKDGIFKPAGFGLEFLNRLYPYYVGKGANYLISTDRHHSYGIVCHNQRPLGFHYYYTKEDEVQKEHLWKYFDDHDNIEIRLKLTDMKDGDYKVKFYRISVKNGNMLEIWKDMGYEKELSRNDIKYFRRMCEPKLTIQNFKVSGGELELSIPMQANEIAFIRVRLMV